MYHVCILPFGDKNVYEIVCPLVATVYTNKPAIWWLGCVLFSLPSGGHDTLLGLSTGGRIINSGYTMYD